MRLFFVCFLLLLVNVAKAGTLTGTIRDEHGVTLPFATVFVAGTTNGTAANASGVYSLTLPAGSYVVTCQYIGFTQTTFTLNIGANETVQHDFRLKGQSLQMNEVVVRASDEDPAYRIIRQAIARRKFHLAQVRDFQTSIYLKGVLRTRQTPEKVFGQKVDKGEMGLDTTGKGVLYLCEEVADYYDQPGRQKTVIHSVKESGDQNGLGLAMMPPVVTFYDNTVEILRNINPRGHISPIADGALGYYRYRLEGEFQEGHTTIYKISVRPKRAYEPLFFGDIYIVDGDWAIHSLSLATSARYGLEKLDTLRIDQLFLPLKKDVWVIKNQQLYPVINILGFGIAGNFVTVYDNQKVNEPVPDSVFDKHVLSTYDKAANKQDSSYWEGTRPIPLEQDELHDYKLKDSLRLVYEDPARIDSLRRRENRIRLSEILYAGIDFTDSGYKNRTHITGLLTSVNYNSVEGLVLEPQVSLRHRLDSSSNLLLRVAPRYGFSNAHFNTEAALTYEYNDPTWRGRGYAVIAEGGRYVYQYNRENPITTIFNTFNTLVLDYNELKVYERWTAALAGRRALGNGWRYWGRIAWERRLPLVNTNYYTFSGRGREEFTPNLPERLAVWHYEAHDALWLRLGVSWKPGTYYIQYPDYKASLSSRWPTFSLQYDRGVPGILGSKVDWDKWRAGATGSFGLKRAGSVAFNLSAGGFITRNYIGLPDLIHLFAGDDPAFTLASPYLRAFQLAPFYRFSNDTRHYGEAHVEWNLKGLLSNKIPGLRQAKWYFIFGTNTFYSSNQLYFSEAFVSLDNVGIKVYRFLRLDYYHAWDSDRRSYDGFRIGLRIAALDALRAGTGDTEW